MAADQNVALTLAKFRALRQLWAHVETSCGLEPVPIRLHAETAWRMMTRRAMTTNVIRGALAALAAALGGADSISVLPFSLPAGAADGHARRLARNTQLILLRESTLSDVMDPAAGAGSFDSLTNKLAEAAWSIFQHIEDSGGFLTQLGSGAFQDQIADTRRTRKARLDAGEDAIIGVTSFRTPEDDNDVSWSPCVNERRGSKLLPHRLSEPFEAEQRAERE